MKKLKRGQIFLDFAKVPKNTSYKDKLKKIYNFKNKIPYTKIGKSKKQVSNFFYISLVLCTFAAVYKHRLSKILHENTIT